MVIRGAFAAIALPVMILGWVSLLPASAQSFPTRAVRMIVPFPPGGGTDLTVRLIAQTLQEQWRQSVVLEYKPGAGTVIATDAVAKSAPDGYTLGVAVSSHWINPSLLPSLPFAATITIPGSDHRGGPALRRLRGGFLFNTPGGGLRRAIYLGH